MPARDSKKAILIHGCHLQAQGWENIAWGDPRRGVYGRAAKGLAQAHVHDADLIIWGTGASQKDGVKESQYTFDYAVAHAQDLPIYRGLSVYEVGPMLKDMSHIDVTSQNTTEEVKSALIECHVRGIQELILVSSPTHIARCHQEALIAIAQTASQTLVYATASDTCFVDSTASDPVIIEPPHRGDLPPWQTHRYAKAMFGIMRQGEGPFANYLGEWGNLLRRFGVDVTWNPQR